MLKALFQHIPRCLFEPVAVLSLIGISLFLIRHWKKDKPETVLFALTLFFMVGWRLVMPINADRYALILIPMAIFFSVTAIREITAFAAKYCRMPDYRIFLGLLVMFCLIKAFHHISDDRIMFEMIKILKAEPRNTAGPLHIVCNRDISCFLGDGFAVTHILIQADFRFSDLPQADYCLLKLNDRKMPQDPRNPDFSEIAAVRAGKTLFLLQKKEKSR